MENIYQNLQQIAISIALLFCTLVFQLEDTVWLTVVSNETMERIVPELVAFFVELERN